MNTSKAFTLLAFSLVCCARVAAIQVSHGQDQAYHQRGAVCISLAAYEDPLWIGILIRNLLRFTDCSTKVALHLNADTNYSNEDIDKISKLSSRLSVNPERIGVVWAMGGILHAHVLNAMHMQKIWGNQCSYYVLQASNMLWIKPGMESYVSEFRLSGMHPRSFGECSGFCRQQGWSEKQRAWKWPEGTFLPMSLMYSFTGDYMKWFHTLSDPDAEFIHAKGAKEEDWLQTYACVHEGHGPLAGPTLCERFGKDTPLTVADVKEMAKGDFGEAYKGKYRDYYADHEDYCERTDPKALAPFSVKVNSGGGQSVTRDPNSNVTKWLDLASDPYLDDPVVKYIMHLTDVAPILSERACHGTA